MSGQNRPSGLWQSSTLVYMVLVVLTLVTWAAGRVGAPGLWLSLGVLAIALLKGGLIGDWFMGLRAVRGLWRWVIMIWLVIPGGLITTAFFLSYRG
jgi:caa(3)-type oxidase subunit IV